jgi:Fur family transcriptional regulator, zinc uptake regulator
MKRATAQAKSRGGHTPAQMMAAAKAICEAGGEQWTDLRATIYKTVASSRKPMSAYDLADQLSRDLNRRIAPNTVYRILDLLVALKLVTRVESRNAFIACQHPDAHHDCVLFVCSSCNEAFEAEDNRILGVVNEVANKVGFEAKRPVVEIHGVCSNCR